MVSKICIESFYKSSYTMEYKYLLVLHYVNLDFCILDFLNA